MSVHPWTNHEIAALRHQERAARASAVSDSRQVLESRRAHAGAVRRSLLSELVGSLRRRASSRGAAATAVPRPS